MTKLIDKKRDYLINESGAELIKHGLVKILGGTHEENDTDWRYVYLGEIMEKVIEIKMKLEDVYKLYLSIDNIYESTINKFDIACEKLKTLEKLEKIRHEIQSLCNTQKK